MSNNNRPLKIRLEPGDVFYIVCPGFPPSQIKFNGKQCEWKEIDPRDVPAGPVTLCEREQFGGAKGEILAMDEADEISPNKPQQQTAAECAIPTALDEPKEKPGEVVQRHDDEIRAACGPTGQLFDTGSVDDIPFFSD